LAGPRLQRGRQLGYHICQSYPQGPQPFDKTGLSG
jgi:hypothetical protein